MEANQFESLVKSYIGKTVSSATAMRSRFESLVKSYIGKTSQSRHRCLAEFESLVKSYIGKTFGDFMLASIGLRALLNRT